MSRPDIADEPAAEPLPEGVFHLLIAERYLARSERCQVAMCGAVVQLERLPDLYDGIELDRNPLFCPACVSEAGRFNADNQS